MEKLCNDCVNYDDDDYENENNVIKSRSDLLEKFNKNIKRKPKMTRPIDFNKINRDLYQALLFPEYAKGFKCILFFNL